MDIEFLRRMMSVEGKEQAIKVFIEYLQSAESISKGIDIIKPSLDALQDKQETNSSDVKNIAKQVSTLFKIQKQQQALMANLTAISIVYLLSDSFTLDTAKTMQKLGYGDEGLKTYAKNKFGHLFK